jgi:hypothetical protein
MQLLRGKKNCTKKWQVLVFYGKGIYIWQVIILMNKNHSINGCELELNFKYKAILG